MDICAHLRQPNRFTSEPARCKQTIARPAIGEIIANIIQTETKLNSIYFQVSQLSVLFS